MPSQFPQFYDLEVVDVSTSDFIPSKQDGVASAIHCTSSGTAYVDAVGFGGTGADPNGATDVPLVMSAGDTIQIAIVRVRKASTSGSYVVAY
jgi:hypothetical protein